MNDDFDIWSKAAARGCVSIIVLIVLLPNGMRCILLPCCSTALLNPYARAYCCHDYDDMIFFQFYLLICILYFHHNECV